MIKKEIQTVLTICDSISTVYWTMFSIEHFLVHKVLRVLLVVILVLILT